MASKWEFTIDYSKNYFILLRSIYFDLSPKNLFYNHRKRMDKNQFALEAVLNFGLSLETSSYYNLKQIYIKFLKNTIGIRKLVFLAF